jgi:PAS domain S-box-containing protein
MKTEILMAERHVAEQALRESEQRYRRLLAATTDYIYSVDFHHDHSINTTHGPGCEAVTGYSPGEFATDPYLWYRVIYEEDRPAVMAQVTRIMNGDVPPPLEHRVIHKNGGIRWISNTPIPHRDSTGHLLGYDGLISDITNRKRAEQFLTSQYTVTRDLAEALSLEEALPKVLRDIGTILFWDRGAYWSAEAGSGTLHRLAVWFSTPPPLQEARGQPAATSSGSGIVRSVLSSGEPAWVPNLDLAPHLASETAPPNSGLHCGCAVPVRALGDIVGVLEFFNRESRPVDPHMLQVLTGLAAQISLFIEQERAEQALRQSQERLALVIQGSNDGIWDWDVATGQAYFSPRWKSMLGYDDDEIENTFTAWEQLLHPEDHEKAVAGIRAYFAGETTSFELVHRLRHKDGTYRWILARGVVLRDAGGKPLRMAGSHVDLTERKLAEGRMEKTCAKLAVREAVLKKILRKLRTSHRALKEAQLHLIQAAKLESVGTLAAGVAHEVKNPLQTILMGLDFVCQKVPADDRDLTDTLTDMRDAVKRASSIIRELLVFSSDTDFQTRPENLNSLIERSLRLLNPGLLAAQTEVVRNLDPQLPRVSIDDNKIQQVFINLFLNAVQAMPSGGTLTLTTRTLRMDGSASAPSPLFRRFEAGDTLVVAEVEDTGHGIPEAALPQVFDPFFTTKPPGVGTGLGLSIAKKIVDLHGGEIQIRNRPSGGVAVAVALRV